MSKRFIDTEIFDNEKFMSLSKDGKLFWIYFITKCNHAGILKVNKKLFEVHTGIKSLETVVKELGNSLVRVSEDLFFCPNFIKFQYPGFPKSTVKQQDSAKKILEEYGLWSYENNSYLTLSEDLQRYYGNDSGNGIGNGSEEGGEGGIKTKPSWRNDYEVYKNELRAFYVTLFSNNEYITDRAEYHPGLDIKKTIEKAVKDFWILEKGWKNKKLSKTKEIDWLSTFNNALTMKCNQVWKQREQQKPTDSFTSVEVLKKTESFTLGEY